MFVKGLKEGWNNIRIRKKMIGIYAISVLLPVFFVSLYLTYSMSNAVYSRMVNEAKTDTVRVRDRVNELLYLMTNISDKIYFDKQLKNIISTKYSSFLEFNNACKSYPALKEYIQYYSQIEAITLYVDNSTMWDNGFFVKTTDTVRKEDWYKAAVRSGGNMIWQCFYNNDNNSYYLALVRRIRIDDNGNYAVMVMRVSYSYLTSVIQNEKTTMLMTVDNDRIVLADDRKKLGTKIDLKGLTAVSGDSEQFLKDVSYENRKVFIVHDSFLPQKTRSTIQIINITPTSDITRQVIDTYTTGILIALISLVAPVMLMVLFTGNFSKRILFIRTQIHRAASGDLDISPGISGSDEIAELYKDLIKMIGDMKKLLQENYEHKLQQQKLLTKQNEAQFKMLASQINPHFLFNTLESIRMKAFVCGQREIATVIKLLGKSMRSLLELDDNPQPLKSELDFVRNYLEIQKFRFAERVDYTIDVQDGIDEKILKVLPLLIQPIVENAFVHGLEQKEGHGRIDIIVNRYNENIMVIVKDDGLGMEAEKLEEVHCKIKESGGKTGKSIGLSNVNQRIKLYYGESYGIRVDSSPGTGTTVWISFPEQCLKIYGRNDNQNAQGFNH
ncbi:sensor histidine kinase [Ruminiclostridium cellulolyticum]|uniref:histidine kinase n=1 Tax=Ruminiclostridium cellulolyticum (strain ATCC 35319 / DSM 5812 / JCM 6584 / H10) TaxID=394503 RepID=B8I617_RUMCH|nr:sensor histidine kinase [Ruminiclostridium cellulolyticum]ACL76782.1 histidine kinase [Ruminiclostridium cellulolyticum H10]